MSQCFSSFCAFGFIALLLLLGSRGRARSLAGLGLFTTLKGYLAGESRHLDDYVADLQAEAAWRTGTWAGDAMSQDVNGSTFNGKIHTLMECIRSKTTSGAFQQTLNDVYRSCSRELSETGIDGWAKIQAVLGKSLLARETEELASVLGGKLRISDMIDVWRQRLKALDEDWQFPDIEPLLSARYFLISCLRSRI